MAHGLIKTVLVFAVLLLADMAAAQTRGYYQALKASSNHKMMVQMIDSNPMYKTLLSNAGLSFTVFAPTDAAFASAAKKYGISPEVAIKQQKLLMAFLQYHVVPGAPVTSKTLKSGTRYLTTMYNGLKLRVSNSKDSAGKPVTWVAGAGPAGRVVKWDQMVASPATGKVVGVIHDITNVLLFNKDPAKVLAIK